VRAGLAHDAGRVRAVNDWLLQTQLLREEDAGVSVVEPERILVSIPQASSVPGCRDCTVTHAQRATILQWLLERSALQHVLMKPMLGPMYDRELDYHTGIRK